MTDRIPGSPGRYSAVITAEELQKLQAGEQFAITLVRDDEPSVVGTPYSKAAVLPDDVAAAICPDVEDPTPADAFSALQKGKAPAGYGLGVQGRVITDFNTATKCGFYATDGNNGAINGPTEYPSMKYGTLLVENRLGVRIQQTLSYSACKAVRFTSDSGKTWSEWEFVNPPYQTDVVYRTTKRILFTTVFEKMDSNKVLWYSTDYAVAEDGTESGTWTKYNNIMGAAPSGYGLGENSPRTTAWDSQVHSGFYKSSNNSPDGTLWFGFTCSSTTARQAQIAFSQDFTNGLTEARRYRNGSDNIGEWEYVNPPMELGVEYRTTERFMGKPVYTKLIDCGAIANKGIDLVGYDEDGTATDFPSVIRYSGVVMNDSGPVYALPHIPNTGGTEDVWLSTDNTISLLSLHCGADWEGAEYTVNAQIWYIK